MPFPAFGYLPVRPAVGIEAGKQSPLAAARVDADGVANIPDLMISLGRVAADLKGTNCASASNES